MALSTNGHTERIYALSTLHCDRQESPALVIARPQGEDTSDVRRKTTAFSSIHYRETLPSIFYTVSGSRLTLTCLATDYDATVLDFGSTIKNVGLEDDSVNLVIHVFLETMVLYSMILQPVNLEQPELKKEVGWISEYTAPSFQIREPLYMQTISATSIIFSLKDGGLLRLSNNGRGYNEHIFSDSSYFSSFKSILPWSGRPANLVISMVGSETKSILYTLSVDARLKVWDVSKGRLLAVHDTFAPDKPPVFLAEPIESRYFSLREHNGVVILVTYCPQRPGLFKVFRGRAGSLEEVYSFHEEQPQDGIWRVFDISIGNVGQDGSLEIHVLWKMDTLMLLQTAQVDVSSRSTVWQFGANQSIINDIPNSTIESLEDYIFGSCRFSSSTLRSALASLPGGSTDHSFETHTAIKEEVSRKLKSSINLATDEETGNVLQDKFDEDLRLQYLNLAQVCLELDTFASEPHSISQSPFNNEILIAQSSKISLVRKASPLEQLMQKAVLDDQLRSPEAETLRASLILRDGLSIDAWVTVADTLRHICLTDRTTSADDAMFLTFEKTTENQLPPALTKQLADGQPSPDSLVKGLKSLTRYLQHSLSDKAPHSTLGVQSYVAEKRSLHNLALNMGTILLAYLTHTACTADEVNIYHMSTLFITYLSIYRHNRLAFETMTKYIEPVEFGSSLSYSAASNSSFPAKTRRSNLVLREIVSMSNGQLSSRDLLDKTIICLINLEQGSLAMHFCQFIQDSPFSFYLRARSLLLNGEYTQSASLFARVAMPLVNSPVTKSEHFLIVKLERLDLVSFHLHVAHLFSEANQAEHAVRFCNEAQLASAASSPEMKREIQERKFAAALQCRDWSEAYICIATRELGDEKDKLRQFVTALCDAGEALVLQTLPLVDLVDDIDAVLERKARNMLDVRTKPSYHKILYGLRIRHGDYRGAAAILYHRLQFLRNRTQVSGFNMADHLEITEGYLAIINAMRCLALEDAWVIIGTIEQDSQQHKRVKKQNSEDAETDVVRKVLKLSDIRAEYNRELHNMEAQLIALREFDD